jgi:parallel beta-helix repeat protein
MKKGLSILSLVLVCVLSMVGLADASTSHGGWITSDETWTLAGSPHIINSLTTVRDGATLTIEPGVEVRFNESATNPRLIIGEIGTGTTGKLIAQGTASQKIKFTSNAAAPQPGDWADIYFTQNTSNDSIIDYAILEYAGKSYGNIQIHSSNPTIRNCIIRKSLKAGIYMYGSASEISGCRFEENEGCGIEIVQSSPVLDANEFINNGSYPIYISGGSGYLEPVIYGTNTFSGNNPDQIYFGVGSITSNHTLRYIGIPYFFPVLTVVRNGATLTIEPGVEVRFNKDATNPRLVIGEGGTGTTGKLIAQGTVSQKIKFTSNADTPQPGDWNSINFNSNASDDSIIEHAIIEYGGVGGIIDINSSNPTIRNCIIRNGSDDGIYIYDSTSEVSCCDITNNDIGIHVVGNILNNPMIINNNIFGNTTYGIQNTTPGYIVNAENNWWGHATGPGGVGPGTGDPVSTGVDYDPWLTMISTCIIPDIKANSTDGPVNLTFGDPLSVTIELDPGNYPGVQADWWVLANTPVGFYYKNLSSGWQPGLFVTHQGPLFKLTPPLEVLNTSGLPTGNYTFYFGVDGNKNGILDGPLFYDSVEVNITP